MNSSGRESHMANGFAYAKIEGTFEGTESSVATALKGIIN